MPASFILADALGGLALAVALMSIPLAVRGAPRSYWWCQLATSLALALMLAGLLYWSIYVRYVAPWRCIVAALMGFVPPTIGAGWGARAAMRLWPRAGRISATLGAIAGLGLVVAIAALATSGLLPDIINATTE